MTSIGNPKFCRTFFQGVRSEPGQTLVTNPSHNFEASAVSVQEQPGQNCRLYQRFKRPLHAEEAPSKAACLSQHGSPSRMFQCSAEPASAEGAPTSGAQPAQFGKPSLTAEVILRMTVSPIVKRRADCQRFKLSIPVPVLSGSRFCGGGPCLGMPSLPSSGNQA